MRTGDLLQVEAAKLAAELHKATAALSIGLVAAIGTYLKAAEVKDVPTSVLICFFLCFSSVFVSLTALLFGVSTMSDGYSPVEKRAFVLSLWLSPFLFFVSAVVGLYVVLVIR